jgi:cyanophycinase
MVLSEMTISDSIDKEKLIKGNVDIWKGMNILSGTIVDTHFFQRMRFTRLALGLLNNPSLIGIGLPENTGVLVKKGYLLEPVGSEMALIMDASAIEVSNFEKAKFGEPVYAGGVKVHFLNNGSLFSLRDRKLYQKTSE